VLVPVTGASIFYCTCVTLLDKRILTWQNVVHYPAERKVKNMSKRQELRAQRVQKERTQRILSIGFVAVVAIAFALVLIIPNLPKPVGNIVVPEVYARPQAKFNTAGDPNAPVKIIEYSDFQCPICGHFWKSETERQIFETYVATDKVYFEYRSAGEFIGGPEGESIRSAEAAYCAGDQNKFWEMHDIIFANQTGENVGDFADPRLIAFAEKIGLDLAAFKDCFNGGKYAAKAQADEQNALKDIPAAQNYAELVSAGQFPAQGFATPSFLINGRLVVGAAPFSVFQQEIDAALAAATK
jgi:protein-disulfide isomerase